jgi:hypothetical protein
VGSNGKGHRRSDIEKKFMAVIAERPVQPVVREQTATYYINYDFLARIHASLLLVDFYGLIGNNFIAVELNILLINLKTVLSKSNLRFNFHCMITIGE